MENIEQFKTEVSMLLEMNEDALYELLSDDVVPPSMGLFLGGKRAAEAKKWFENKKALLQSKICGSLALQYNLYDNDRYETVMTVATVIDLITGVLGSVPVNVVAVLIVKQGHKIFCKDFQAHDR